MNKTMRVIGGLLLTAGLLITPVSLLLQSGYQSSMFIVGTSALGFGLGLLLAANITRTLGIAEDPFKHEKGEK
ncbi:MAG: hypothetical protein WD625_04860 [Balneolales bacterium]